MEFERHGKLKVGDLAYVYPSNKQAEGKAGIVLEVLKGRGDDEPHIKFQQPNGKQPVLIDYDKVGYGGPPPRAAKGTAIVKWLGYNPPVPPAALHMEWLVEQVCGEGDSYWVLARDPWTTRLHWLPSRSGKQDSEYTLSVTDIEGRSHLVAMQGFKEL